ncbi:MAG TPA: MFS transporter [Solirubrobacterales bacterium]|jgi:EmrB/QacA subfamily drug resistance transporter|nr:MFS transporter [Solirubrobacterales bacterium]
MNQSPAQNSKLILAAMIFAVSMTFIDQTIVAIAIPTIQDDLTLSATGVQWIINGYLLSLSALFAFGGRLADIAGHRRMVVLGVVIFATASALCGATPTGSLDETWLIVFRVIQGAGAAIMFPAALAIVLNAFPVAERGKAMAIFFAIAGGLTAIGPLAGGYLVEITWRAIFWVNIPVAIIALFLIWKSKPADEKHPAELDYTGTMLITGGMALAVLGLQQSSIWGWDDAKTWGCIAVGLGILAAFVRYELRVANPLLRLTIFKDKAFAVDNIVLFLLMIPFVPLFFFASMYAQISLGESASETGLYLLIFFAGFATASQWGGKMLDRIGARRPMVLGCGVAAVGFYLWGHSLTELSVSNQWYYIVIAGAGVGLVLSPANTDALNRVSRDRYGEATGITQTVRNFGSSLGLAVLGSVLILENRSNLEATADKHGFPKEVGKEIADQISQGTGAGESPEHLPAQVQKVVDAIPHDFALASRTVFYGMAAVMAVAFVIALVGMPAGKVEEEV